MPESILQNWVQEQPLKMQTVLCLGTRGQDTHNAPQLKKIVRWVRAQVYKPADPDNPHFMLSSLERLPEIVEKSPVAKELEFCTQHYFAHLMHALEIIGYRHPDPNVAALALGRYQGMVALFHLHPETPLELAKRLGWMEWALGQPQTFEEAMKAPQSGGAQALRIEVDPSFTIDPDSDPRTQPEYRPTLFPRDSGGSFADHQDFLPRESDDPTVPKVIQALQALPPGASQEAKLDAVGEAVLPIPGKAKGYCHAGKDGECSWGECPQKRDGEPEKSGRPCPLYQREEED